MKEITFPQDCQRKFPLQQLYIFFVEQFFQKSFEKNLSTAINCVSLQNAKIYAEEHFIDHSFPLTFHR
jgi:hypothetical protein